MFQGVTGPVRVQELHLGRPGCSALVFGLLLEHLSLNSYEKLMNSIDFHDFLGSWARMSGRPVAACAAGVLPPYNTYDLRI